MASEGSRLTNGGESGASGGDPASRSLRPAALAAIVFAAFGLLYLVVNATSQIDERRALGQPVESWQPWTWEATSFVAWLLLLPVILWIGNHGPSFGRPVRALAVHLLATIPVSLGHGAIMVGLRQAVYAAVGETYRRSEPFLDVLVYEYRKDAITYASILVLFLVVKRLSAPPPATGGREPAEVLIEVKDGSRTLWLKPGEIEWVAAAGNYVELNGRFGTTLARRTLAEMEAELGPHGFVRVHRSRLVRKASIAKVDTRQSGDFEVTLRSGSTLVGSRRYRSNLQPDATVSA